MCEAILSALALPRDALVDKRIPKKLLVEQGAPTAADNRQIQDGIEELNWVAALKPTNIGVPVFRNDEREYLEVAVLTVAYRPKAKTTRLNELIHRAVPYPVLLVSALHGDTTSLMVSAAHKRFAQNGTGKIVIEEMLATPSIIVDDLKMENVRDFLAALDLSNLPTKELYALYQGWLDRIVAFTASSITGRFARPESAEQTGEMQARISAHNQILSELAVFRVQAGKEKQMNRLIELNLKIKRLESQLASNQSALHRQTL